MTRRDTWANKAVRPSVQRWRAFRDAVQAAGLEVKDGDALLFVVPMPPSWSAKKRAAMEALPHRQKPDLDNLIGGLFDAAMPEGDQHIARLGACGKVWGRVGVILVTSEKTD